MPWGKQETHHVGSYVFHWFSDDDGAWLVAIWAEMSAPPEARLSDVERALTVHHISARDNPKGGTKAVREFCQRFMSDIPFRVRVIRNKIPTVRRLIGDGALLARKDS